MANILLSTQTPTPELLSSELNSTVKQQVADILEEAVPERPRQTQRVRAAQWGYTVPFAGVRYYSY